ncbi:NAD(P)-dependent oxidoreductase [Coraliomargarita sp. SDUM461004]|uniref:NAD(P)-dependent oxidoreductase n=1 Tax=Thalassobacterium sedimentorum TaxID=3041258 RepID=A0ABU1ALP0_9BACT|nr:NAD(P)-dependent oxidoreductase [Coraliomargarita sp. SDUM461004]MDQ8194691.1 NAD(P)-dependent oxidoreductase [Coraliomargarita sp. SDUM461004]
MLDNSFKIKPTEVDQAVRSCLFVLTEQERKDFFGDESLQDLLGDNYRVVVCHLGNSDELERLVRDFRPEMIVGAWKTPELRFIDGQLPARYYCHLAGSIRRTVPRSLIEAGMVVTNWGASISRYVAEAALMLGLSASRNLGHHTRNFHERGMWRTPHIPAWSLFERRVGVHGFGNISRELVQLLAPFKTTISVWDPFVSDESLVAAGVRRADSLADLFSSADFLFECCALTEETEGVVDRSLLERLPETAVFVNVARGRLVDEVVLAELVSSGRIRAGVDVFRVEPYPSDGAIRDNDFSVVMPHLGGNTVDSRRYAGRMALRRMQAYFSGVVPEDLVDLQRYDRMT